MAQSDELLAAMLEQREAIIIKLGAAERQSTTIRTFIQPDYNSTPYEGLSDRDYILWQFEEIGEDWTFLLDVKLTDYGYDIDDLVDGEYWPKSTSDYQGYLRYSLEFVDRFSGRLAFRGFLNGSSAELDFSILLKLSIFGHRQQGPLGFAGETLAEGYAFELEKRWKQAFFCYFSALESMLDIHRRQVNFFLEDSNVIPENERLRDKLSKVTSARLHRNNFDLSKVGFWGWLRSQFVTLEALRNAIAHNEPHKPIYRQAAAEIFVIFAIVAAIFDKATPDVAGVLRYFDVPHRGAPKQLWGDDN